jgi:hypothetical protein
MKKVYFFLSFILTLPLISKSQDVIWREGFTRGGTSNFPISSGSAAPAPGQYYISSAGLTWYGYGLYNANSSQNCPNAAGNSDHIRLLGAPPAGGDSSFIITPVANWAGIGQVHFQRARTSKRYTFYKTSDTLASTTNWTLVAHLPAWAYTTCVDTFVTINDVAARRVKIAIQLSNDTDIDSMWATSATLLPVTFLNIKASKKDIGVEVNWSAAQEINADKYVIEKSGNGLEFAAAGYVAAKGNTASPVDYAWYDANPSPATNYYRIKALDKDGSFRYSIILKINISNTKAEIAIAPNPVKGNQLNVQFSSLTKGNYTLQLYNTVGQIVYKSQLSTEGGSLTQSFVLPSTVKAGIYTLQVTGGDIQLNKRVVVQ